MIDNMPLIIPEDKAYIDQLLSREVERYEIAIPHAHPKVVAYRGCAFAEGRIIGLCLTIYRGTYGAFPR